MESGRREPTKTDGEEARNERKGKTGTVRLDQILKPGLAWPWGD